MRAERTLKGRQADNGLSSTPRSAWNRSKVLAPRLGKADISCDRYQLPAQAPSRGRMDTKTRKADIRAPRAAAPLRYQSGFGNHFESEAVPGALPVGRNSPQRPPHGLYAELISGTSF